MNGETVTIFAGCVEDISPATTPNVLEVTLSDVDVSQVVQEIGIDSVLSEISDEDIQQYLNDKKEREEEDEKGE